jgi:hypothetical protein
MAGIFAVLRTGGTERRGNWDPAVFTTMGGALSLTLEVSVRELFLRQSQGRRVQPDSWRCAGGGRWGARGRHDLGMRVVG